MIRFLNLKHLKLRGGLLLSALLLGLALPQSLSAEDIRFGQGLLWKVQRDGGPASHILGTIHSTDPRLRDLPPEVDRAFESSGIAVFEMIDHPGVKDAVAQAMQLPPGRRLEDILGPELFRRTAEAAAKLGIPAEGLQRLKPWALSTFLIYPQVELLRLAQGEPAFDNWLQAEANRRGKTVYGLETLEEQIGVFDEMSEAEQVAMVADMVSDHGRIQTQFNRIFRAYLKGDLSVAMAVANDVSGVSDPAAAERFRQRLLDDRNITMVEDMTPLLREGGAFIAIGAAHLPGDGGVLDLLENQGYSVTRAY